MRPISHTDQKIFAELVERAEVSMTVGYPPNGSMQLKTVRGERYWYYAGYDRGGIQPGTGKFEKFVGPADRPDLEDLISRFAQAKSSYLERRKSVSALKRAGFPSPSKEEGAIIEALALAGVFSAGAVLIGTMAFQTFPGLVGHRFGPSGLQTKGVDVGRRRRIPLAGDIEVASIEDALRGVDSTFRPLFHAGHPDLPLRFENGSGFRVEFLPDASTRGDLVPVAMKGMGGLAAQPLGFLEYLLEYPVRSVLLHEAGLPVLVPDPARYAVHKLLASSLRKDDPADAYAKSPKDVLQATEIIMAMTATGPSEGLGVAWLAARNSGPSWRRHLGSGLARLDPESARRLGNSAALAANLYDDDADGGFGQQDKGNVSPVRSAP